MGFVNIKSMEALDAFKRKLEIPSVAQVALGKLRVDDVLGMNEEEGTAAFRLVRFFDSKGIPKCPKCSSTETYALATRSIWRCAHCRCEFSVTSGTMLSGRKMGMRSYLALLSILLDKGQFKSLLEFSRETNISYKTCWDQMNRLRASTLDEKGCTVPFSLLSKEAWESKLGATKKYIGRFIAPTKLNQYPFMQETERKIDGADLLAFVNSKMPRGLPEHIRADACQDIILAVLEGQITRDQISKGSKDFMSKVFQQYPWKYKWISFDAPTSDENDRTLAETMSNEDAEERFLFARVEARPTRARLLPP